MHPSDGGTALQADLVQGFHERAMLLCDATAAIAAIPVVATNQLFMGGGAPDDDRKEFRKAAAQLPDIVLLWSEILVGAVNIVRFGPGDVDLAISNVGDQWCDTVGVLVQQ